MIRCRFCHQDNPGTSVECTHCGATLPRPQVPDTATPELEKQIQDLLAHGKKIEAIKRLREETGAGLKEAKDAVEAMEIGRPLSTLPTHDQESLRHEVAELLQNQGKIDAIKRFREYTGAGLKEAKDAVEAIEQGRSFALLGKLDQGLESELTELLQAGRKIEAIKRFREQTGAGLKEAKDAVERFAAAHGLAGSRGTGCLKMVLLAAMLIVELLIA